MARRVTLVVGTDKGAFVAHSDERRALRPHVLCFLNQTDSRWLDSNQHPLHDGDVLLFT